MITCPYCHHTMPEGALFCEECGLSLLGDSSTDKLKTESEPLKSGSGWGTATLREQQRILLHIDELTTEPLTIQPDAEFVMGRSDPNRNIALGLDLTDYGAAEKGVSRVHAALRRSEDVLAVIDLGSTNGTFLNGQRLPAHQPRLVRDGDEIRLGELVMYIYFEVI